MTRIRTIALATVLIAAGAASAAAQGYGYGGYGSGHGGYGNGGYNRLPDQTDMRQARQQHRIERGMRDGSLTPRESAALIEEQRRIAEAERRARADGYVDPYERARLGRMQNNASRNIASERHDFEGRNAAFDRPWWRRWWW